MSPRLILSPSAHLPCAYTANRGFLRFAALFLMFLSLIAFGSTSLQAQQGRWTLTGQVALTATASTLTGTLGGIELTLTDETGSTVSVATSNIAGDYLFANVTTGVFTVTPRRAGATFFPSSTTVTVTMETVRVPTFLMLPALPVITGSIVMQQNPAIPFPFATVALTNTNAPNVVLRPQVQSDGRFSIAVSTAGTYVIAPQALSLREGYVITPPDIVSTTNASTTVFVDAAANVNNNQFRLVARIPTYRLSGSVRFDYEPGAAIIDIVQLSSAGTALQATAMTTLATVTGEPYFVHVTNASYRVTSRLTIAQTSFYVSTPTLHTINVRSRDIDALNFIYDPRYITISGKIVRVIGTARIPVQKMPIRLAQFNTNNVFDSASTDSDGAYSLRVRALDNTLPLTIILPPPTDYTFTYQNTPLQLRENVVRGMTVALLDLGALRQNTILDDIIATPVPPREYTITGRVLYRTSAAPVREVLTAIVTNATNSMFTMTDRRRVVLDADGNYSLSVTAGSYQLSFLAERHIFSPALRTLDVPRETEGFRQNFQAVLETMTVTGVVQTILGTPITGATIRLGGGGVDGITVQTDAAGRYRVNVPDQFPDNRFFLVPSVPETTLYPPSRLVVVNFATPNLVNMDFRATSTTNTLPLASISGRITVRESTQERGLADVVISDGTRSVKTDANGNYTLANVPNGTYSLTASLENYSFTPPSLAISVIGGSRPRNQNFVANLRPFTANRAPVLQTQPYDVPVLAASTTRVPIAALFSDPNGDALAFSSYVEDPTILRTRMNDGFLFVDALTEGNTMVNVVANDNRGGTITASFRVTVNRPIIAPRLFTRPKGNINTNFNAALIVRAETLITMLAQTNSGGGKDNTIVNAVSGELGAFNSNCECVGSIVWTGTDAVLPVWAEDKENKIPGMKENEPIDIRFIDEINRKTRRGRFIYILGGPQPMPGIWPIDQGIINIAELNDDPCVATITSVFSSSNAANNSLKASIQPNPSVSRAQLRYTLPAAGKISIELWNTMGQLVSKVHEGYQDAGEQVFNVDVDALPTGTYLCRIRRDGTTIGDVSTVRISVIR